MPFVPVAPPQPLPIAGPIAAIAVDAQRRRVFVAGAHAVVVLDAQSGKTLATIRVEGVRSIALEPLGGHLFAGTGDGAIDDLDPDRKNVARTGAAGGSVDVLSYDAQSGKLYASGAAIQGIGVFDGRSFARIATIALPGPAAAVELAPDPITHDLYAAGAEGSGIAVIDTTANAVRTTFATPGITGRRRVRFDDAFGELIVTGTNGVLDIFDRAGLRRAHDTIPAGPANCAVDTGTHVIACTGPAGLTFAQLSRQGAPLARGAVPLPAPAIAAPDTIAHEFVTVHSNPDGSGAEFQRFRATDALASPLPSSL